MQRSRTQLQSTETARRVSASDPRFRAVAARDASASFVYAVVTTGVYCRPGCSARLPRPENVRFFSTSREAEGAGFRPCKRCVPGRTATSGDLRLAVVTRACRRLEQDGEVPSLAALARDAGMSASHFHRLFRSAVGVTPKAYASAQRARRLRAALTRSRSVTNAVYDAGFSSTARFHAASREALGMTPSAYRAGAPATRLRFAMGTCSLGEFLVAASDRGVSAVLLGDDADALVAELVREFPRAELVGGDRDFDALVARVVGIIEGKGAARGLPLDIRGTAFQQRVFRALARIPVGSTATYSEIAERIGAPRAVRAVGRACAANALAVVVPCHRVVRRDGGLSGYRWGVARKRALLARERQSS